MARSMAVVIGIILSMIVFSHDVLMVLDPHGEAVVSHDADHAEPRECGPPQGVRLPSDDDFDAGTPDAAILTITIPGPVGPLLSPSWEEPVITGSVLRAMLQVYLN